MKDVSPGRDMVLCRLKGCNLEHAGIIQGMSGSPIYIDGKLLGAVAFAWEFAKDPIAGVTPFSQMVQYVRSNDRRIAAESQGQGRRRRTSMRPRWAVLALDRGARRAMSPGLGGSMQPLPVSGGAMGGMTPIVTPLAASGFSPRAARCWPTGSGRSAWRRWPAVRRPSGSSTRRAIAPWYPALR